jgi:hypothetical protein
MGSLRHGYFRRVLVLAEVRVEVEVAVPRVRRRCHARFAWRDIAERDVVLRDSRLSAARVAVARRLDVLFRPRFPF